MPPLLPGADVPVGAIVEVPAGKGVVRFCGQTSFATGKWVGIELSEPNGKNDGSVEGVAYFRCELKYGMFVRPTQIRSIELPGNAAAPLPVPGRPTHKTAASVSHGRSPPTRSATSRSIPASGAASPTKLAPGPGPSSRVPARPRLMPPTPIKRASPSSQSSSQLPSSSRLQTQGLGRPSAQQQLAQLPSRRLSLAQPPTPVSTTSEVGLNTPAAEVPPSLPQSPHPRTESPAPSEPAEFVQQPLPLPAQAGLDPSVIAPQRSADDSHELRVKLRVLETKRADDARRIRELEGRLSEAETFVALRPKLQAKLQALQTENLALKRSVADQATNVSSMEKKLEENAEQMEMMMLDKEVAEERAEVAEAELEGEKEAKAQLEVELEVWRKGQATPSDAESDVNTGRSEMAFRQLEKQNERLKEALIKLRDLTQETDGEQRRRIADLEKELAGVDDMQAQYAQTLARLEHADLQVEDLKQQLDDALGAEEILVQLTERNLLMGEKIEEMRITIEDLEALRELNDELEEAHVETEKGMQEEISQKEQETRELQRKIDLLQDGLQDYETTVQQFRELVSSLQSELDTLREQDQTRHAESQAQASQSAALMSLNLRLQSSAVKNQAKNIDFELRKLDAMQSKEMLSIIQPYLPQVYVETDSDPTNCYMFFQRIAFKMDLINTVVAAQHGLPDSLNGSISEKLVGVCDMRGRIAHLSALCKRFAAVLRHCEPELFLNSGRIYPEVAPLEKRVDMHIDLLRREEFRELECVSDIAKMLAQFEHLGETYFSKVEYDVGERELDLACQIDYDLDTFYATLGLTKSTLETISTDEDVELEFGDLDLNSTLFAPLQSLLNQSKAPRSTSKKILRRVEELVNESSALKTHIVPQWSAIVEQVTKLVEFGIPFAQTIGTYIGEVRAQKHPFQLSAVLTLVRQTVNRLFGNNGSSWSVVEEAIGVVTQELSAVIPLVLDAENVMQVSGQAPWVTRVEEIRTIAAVNLDAERAVAKLNDEILMLVKGVKTRDQTIQESAAKIELMERRMETVKQQADAIADLENQLAKANKQEKSYEEAIEQLQADLDNLDRECSRLKQQLAAAPERSAPGTQAPENETTTIEGNYETTYLLEQIESLRGTVRFLRSENSYLKGQDLLREIYTLPELPSFQPITPPLSPTNSTSEISTPPATPEAEAKPSLRSLATETKLLYRDVINYSASIRVVDLSKLNTKKGKGWMPHRESPAGQLWERKLEGEKLARRVKGLVERAGHLDARIR